MRAWRLNLVVLVCLSACSTDWRGPAVLRSASGRRICAKHHVPLITVRGFEATSDTLVDPYEAWFQIAAPYPNHIPEYQSLQRDRDFSEPTMITYCPKCQHELDARWHEVDERMKARYRKRSNQTMKPTAPLRCNFSVFATTPCRGLSFSR